MRDYLKFNNNPTMDGVRLLKYGRHFRFNGAKIIVGRNELENNFLVHLKGSDGIIMEASNVKGPITLIQGNIDASAIKIAARLTLRYSDALKPQGEVLYGREPNILNEHITVEKATQEFLTPYLL